MFRFVAAAVAFVVIFAVSCIVIRATLFVFFCQRHRKVDRILRARLANLVRDAVPLDRTLPTSDLLVAAVDGLLLLHAVDLLIFSVVFSFRIDSRFHAPDRAVRCSVRCCGQASFFDCPFEDFLVALWGVYFDGYFHLKISLARLHDSLAPHASFKKFADEVIIPGSLAVRPRSAPTPFVLCGEPNGACLREGLSEGDVVVSLSNELLLGLKLVRVARGIEDGVALQAISSGLVASALGEDDVFVTCPLRNAASELVIRKPTDAAKAASVVCAANGFPAAGFFVPLCAFAPVWLPLLERQSLMAAKARGEV